MSTNPFAELFNAKNTASDPVLGEWERLRYAARHRVHNLSAWLDTYVVARRNQSGASVSRFDSSGDYDYDRHLPAAVSTLCNTLARASRFHPALKTLYDEGELEAGWIHRTADLRTCCQAVVLEVMLAELGLNLTLAEVVEMLVELYVTDNPEFIPPPESRGTDNQRNEWLRRELSIIPSEYNLVRAWVLIVVKASSFLNVEVANLAIAEQNIESRKNRRWAGADVFRNRLGSINFTQQEGLIP